jgi:hypothetical protein
MSYEIGEAHVLLVKDAADKPITSYGLTGELVLSRSGWVLLTVPNDLVRGAFSALDEPGIELPPSGPNSRLNAHISVIRPEELEAAGIDPQSITERGRRFAYTLGPVQSVTPKTWSEMSRVWFIQVQSPALKQLRKTYGLTPLPHDNEHQFHITIAVRRKNVLRDNGVRKAASLVHNDDTLPFFPAAQPSVMPQLLAAKHRSDVGDYAAKHAILRELLRKSPSDFFVDDPEGKYHGITHRPTGFRYHLPPRVYRDLLRGMTPPADGANPS